MPEGEVRRRGRKRGGARESSAKALSIASMKREADAGRRGGSLSSAVRIKSRSAAGVRSESSGKAGGSLSNFSAKRARGSGAAYGGCPVNISYKTQAKE